MFAFNPVFDFATDHSVKDNHEWEGIIAHLTKRSIGNVHTFGLVTVTSSSVLDGNPLYAPEHVTELRSKSVFRSNLKPREWICWDFLHVRVQMTHFRILGETRHSWKLAGSVDGRRWQEIARETNTKAVEEAAPERGPFRGWRRWSYSDPVDRGALFPVSKSAQFRFLRLTGKCELALTAVEFFGTLYE
jgi:hypothetical protein